MRFFSCLPALLADLATLSRKAPAEVSASAPIRPRRRLLVFTFSISSAKPHRSKDRQLHVTAACARNCPFGLGFHWNGGKTFPVWACAGREQNERGSETRRGSWSPGFPSWFSPPLSLPVGWRSRVLLLHRSCGVLSSLAEQLNSCRRDDSTPFAVFCGLSSSRRFGGFLAAKGSVVLFPSQRKD